MIRVKISGVAIDPVTKGFVVILKDDKISVINLQDFRPKGVVTAIIYHSDGSQEQVPLIHSYNDAQLKWFRAGSALNILRTNDKV